MLRVLAMVFAALLSFSIAAAQEDVAPPVADTVVSVYGDGDNDKEENRPLFSVISQPDRVQTRRVPDEKVEELKRSEDYWYANLEPKKEEPKKEESSGRSLFDQKWFLNLLWIIILCSFIGVVIWYLASSNIQLFSKASKKIAEEEAQTEIGDDIFNIQYEKEIIKAVSVGNYRLAVRLWYLRTLKEMADRNVIAYRHEKPNGDYLTALYGSRYYQPFFRLTRNFEYTWYGQFPISADAYERMQADFSNFKNSLG